MAFCLRNEIAVGLCVPVIPVVIQLFALNWIQIGHSCGKTNGHYDSVANRRYYLSKKKKKNTGQLIKTKAKTITKHPLNRSANSYYLYQAV